MDFISEDIQKYIINHTSVEPSLLRKIERETFAQVLMPRMLSGHYQGRVLSMLSKMKAPSAILEVGTYTGYSALCLVEGLKEDGKLYTIDINEELEDRVRQYFRDSGFSKNIEYIIGDASHIIPTLEVKFDFVFIDADKVNYSSYFDLIIDKVNVGGLIIADNVLWSGKVTQSGKGDNDTEAILDFNKKIQADPRVANFILPVRDGLMMMIKI